MTYNLSGTFWIVSSNLFSEDWLLQDKKLQDRIPTEFLSHKEKYEEAIRKTCLLFKKLEETDAAFETYRYVGWTDSKTVLNDVFQYCFIS